MQTHFPFPSTKEAKGNFMSDIRVNKNIIRYLNRFIIYWAMAHKVSRQLHKENLNNHTNQSLISNMIRLI